MYIWIIVAIITIPIVILGVIFTVAAVMDHIIGRKSDPNSEEQEWEAFQREREEKGLPRIEDKDF